MGLDNSESKHAELRRDAALMARMQQGEAAAYRELMTLYARAVLSFAYRLLGNVSEAEDVTQEAFLRLWKLESPWRQDAKVVSWLYRVAHNLCTDRLRRRREVGLGDEELPTDSRRPSAVLERLQAATAVQEAIAALPERQRAALVMAHFDEMSNPEIAEVLGVGVEAVESLLSRARRRLRAVLGDLA